MRKVQGARCRQPHLRVVEAGQRRNFPRETPYQVFLVKMPCTLLVRPIKIKSYPMKPSLKYGPPEKARRNYTFELRSKTTKYVLRLGCLAGLFLFFHCKRFEIFKPWASLRNRSLDEFLLLRWIYTR